MAIVKAFWVLAMAVVVTGCAGGAHRGGMLSEVTVDRLLGSKVGGDESTLAADALLGPYQGTEVGRMLDVADRRIAGDTARQGLETLPDNGMADWSNPDTGHSGSFALINTYTSMDGLRCRDFRQSITIDRQTQDEDGAACRTDDGSWRAVATPVRRSVR